MTQITVKGYFDKEPVKKKFAELLGDNSVNFVTSVLQVVNGSNMLKKCEPESIFNAAAMSAVLNLPINQNLGFAYILPYGNKAQFQLGYKGFIQLAIRSGQYKTIGATAIYEGQIIKNNPLTGYEFDFNVKPEGNPIGFAASFTLKGGFEKTFYMTIRELVNHGKKYSKSYNSNHSIWKTDFTGMATKTVLKLLISKFGPMSLELEKAVLSDQSVVNNFEENKFEYPDHDKNHSNEAEIINAEIIPEISNKDKPAEEII